MRRSIEFKQIPLLSLEDTILTAIQDARNVMVAYALIKTQSDRINYDLLYQELGNYRNDATVLASFLDNSKMDIKSSSTDWIKQADP